MDKGTLSYNETELVRTRIANILIEIAKNHKERIDELMRSYSEAMIAELSVQVQ